MTGNIEVEIEKVFGDVFCCASTLQKVMLESVKAVIIRGTAFFSSTSLATWHSHCVLWAIGLGGGHKWGARPPPRYLEQQKQAAFSTQS